MGGDTQTYAQTDTQTYTHINTMTRPGLGAGPSEEEKYLFYIREKETTPISFQLSVTSGHPMLPLLTAYLPLFLRYNTPLHNIELYYQTWFGTILHYPAFFRAPWPVRRSWPVCRSPT